MSSSNPLSVLWDQQKEKEPDQAPRKALLYARETGRALSALAPTTGWHGSSGGHGGANGKRRSQGQRQTCQGIASRFIEVEAPQYAIRSYHLPIRPLSARGGKLLGLSHRT